MLIRNVLSSLILFNQSNIFSSLFTVQQPQPPAPKGHRGGRQGALILFNFNACFFCSLFSMGQHKYTSLVPQMSCWRISYTLNHLKLASTSNDSFHDSDSVIKSNLRHSLTFYKLLHHPQMLQDSVEVSFIFVTLNPRADGGNKISWLISTVDKVSLKMLFCFLVSPCGILIVQISFLQSYQRTPIVNNETGKFPMNVVIWQRKNHASPVRPSKGGQGFKSSEGTNFTWSLKSCWDTRLARTDCPS